MNLISIASVMMTSNINVLYLLGRVLFGIKREDKSCPETGLQKHHLFRGGKTIIGMAQKAGGATYTLS